MRNKAMKKSLRQGFLVDVSAYPRIAGYYVIPWDDHVRSWEAGRVDFADATTEEWIWSIGRALKSFNIKGIGNVDYLVHKGQVLASTSGSFYQNEYFDCLWLR